jgi:hypothetical protein
MYSGHIIIRTFSSVRKFQSYKYFMSLCELDFRSYTHSVQTKIISCWSNLLIPVQEGTLENVPFIKQSTFFSPSCRNPSLQLTISSVVYVNLTSSDFKVVYTGLMHISSIFIVIYTMIYTVIYIGYHFLIIRVLKSMQNQYIRVVSVKCMNWSTPVSADSRSIFVPYNRILNTWQFTNYWNFPWLNYKRLKNFCIKYTVAYIYLYISIKCYMNIYSRKPNLPQPFPFLENCRLDNKFPLTSLT